MKLSTFAILLIFIGMVSSQSFICSRTATTDSWCNDDGTITTTSYSTQVNIQMPDGSWQPFEWVANFTWDGSQFNLNYNDQSYSIQPFAIMNDNSQVGISDSGATANPVIIPQRGGFEFGLNLTDASSISQVGFTVVDNNAVAVPIGGHLTQFQQVQLAHIAEQETADNNTMIGTSDIAVDFSDSAAAGLVTQSSDTMLVNTSGQDSISIDPFVYLNESNSGNVGDTYVDGYNPGYNYGITNPIQVQSWTSGANRIFTLWNLTASNLPSGAVITDAELSMYISSAAASRTYQAYNTSVYDTSPGGMWIEGNKNGATGSGDELTWNNQPAAGTLQDSVVTGSSSSVWLTWNVTNATKLSYAQSNKNMSIMIRDSSESGTQYTNQFQSKEGTAGLRPQLNITYYNCPLNYVHILAYNESNTSQYLKSFSFTASNSTSTFSYVTGQNGENSAFLTYYCNMSFPIGAITVSISNSSFYSPRYYYSTLAAGGSYTLPAYLLPFSDSYAKQVTFLVTNQYMAGLPNIPITQQVQVNGVWTTVDQETTDASGVAGFYVDSTTPYNMIFNGTAAGYSLLVQSYTPKMLQYTVILSPNSTASMQQDILSYVNYTYSPRGMVYNTTTTFSLTVSSKNSSIGSYGLNITNSTGSVIYSNSASNPAGGIITTSQNLAGKFGYVNSTVWFNTSAGLWYSVTFTNTIYSTAYSNSSILQIGKGFGSIGLSPSTLALIALIFSMVVTGAFAKTGFSLGGSGVVFTLSMAIFFYFGWVPSSLMAIITLMTAAFLILKYY